ncbi:MAG TPA: LTA synthase family protein, partial [Bacteroidales bacterium]|nr:LTA synthase family protein [Bacteroidales bacterium]
LIKGIGNDMILLFRISLLLFPLFWILQIISRFAVITIEVLLLLSYTATTVFLLYYFGITGSLLDHVIIGYSNANAWHTMESYLRYAGWFLLLTAIICVLTIFVFRSVRKVKVNGKTGMILLLSIIILSYIIPLNLRNYTSVYTYSQKIAVNKIVYFIRDISNNNNNNTEYHYNNSVINNAVRKWHKQFPEKKFVSKEYPLLYKNNNNANPLEPFFKKTKEKVNVVVVILESIGREISGPDAPLESFTPFLDSLASQSLYWKNCLSTSERTFGVLPAFFGSLPYGKKGFLAMGNNMPWQYSLIRILNNNGYRSSFYYGGWTEFDNMATFFYRQGGDYVLDSFGQSYTKMDTIHDFCWGYGDRDVFRRSLEVIDSTEKSPRLDIYLTLSTHSPWIFLNQKTYIQKLRNYINKKGFSKSKKEDIWDQKARFSSILYADDAVRFLFNELKKRPDFNNTLFIVTGDHSMSLVPDNSLNRYHVPLIMYSPLLKRAGQFSGITSHMDITPGLLALLSNYGIKSPDTVHWMGTMIDTSMQFRNIETLPFMLNNRNISQLLYDSCYLDRDKLYSFDKSLSLHPLQNKKEFDKGVNILRTERIIHNTIPGLSRILPEELFLQNTSAKKILDISNKFTEAQQILPENQFFSIQSNAFPENQFQNLYVDFSFDYSFLDNRAGEFSLIMEILDKKGEKLVWQPWKTENTHGPTIWMTNHDSKYFFLKNLKPKEISSIKLYFWNNHDQSFRIRNFNLQIIAE